MSIHQRGALILCSIVTSILATVACSTTSSDSSDSGYDDLDVGLGDGDAKQDSLSSEEWGGWLDEGYNAFNELNAPEVGFVESWFDAKAGDAITFTVVDSQFRVYMRVIAPGGAKQNAQAARSGDDVTIAVDRARKGKYRVVVTSVANMQRAADGRPPITNGEYELDTNLARAPSDGGEEGDSCELSTECMTGLMCCRSGGAAGSTARMCMRPTSEGVCPRRP